VASQKTPTKKKPAPKPIGRFPYTLRVQAYEYALRHGLHLVRDFYHLWAIRLPKNEGEKFEHIWLCHSNSYDGLWRAAINMFREPDFNPFKQPYAVNETESSVILFDPVTRKERRIDKKDLRSRRGG